MSTFEAAVVPSPILSVNKSSAFHSILLCVAIFLTATISSVYYSFIFLITLFVYLFLYKTRLDRNTKRVLLPLIGMMLLGIAFAFNNNVYDVFKDVWYAGKAVVCLLLGYYVARKINNINLFFNYFIWVSFVLALIYVANKFIGTGKVGIVDMSGTSGLLLTSAMVVPLILFRKTGSVFRGNRILGMLIVSVIVAAFALSLSRTYILSLLILTLAGAGFFDNLKKLTVIIVPVIFAGYLISTILPNIDPQEITFLGKVNNSLSEMGFTDDSDPTRMIVNWRGFEAYNAYVAFTDASILQQIFGRGWGATVDIGLYVQMSEDMEYRYLPILHNGYLHILTKYGALGFFIYLIFLWRVAIGSKNYFIRNGNITYARFSLGLGLVLVYTSLVITGILNRSNLDSVLVMFGFFLGSVSLHRTGRFYACRNVTKQTEHVLGYDGNKN